MAPRKAGLLAQAPIALVLALTLNGCDGCGATARTAIPEANAPRATGEITLDGILDEADWDQATVTERFVRTMDGLPGEPVVTARLMWNDDSLLVAFEVRDDFLKCTLEGHDAHLWEQDAVELMIDPDGDGEGYFELQVSPTNLVFDTRFDTVRQPAPFGYPAWQSGLVAGVDARGTPNDDEMDDGYTVEARIPFAAFAAGSDPAEPPQEGQTWRVALYVLDARPEGQSGVGWSPPLVGDFHVPDRFGRVTFSP